MKKAVNITVPCSHNGTHYRGVAMHDGVGFSLVDAPCGPARQMIQFTNTDNAPTGIFFDQVSCVDDQSAPEPTYLQVTPAE